MNTQILIDNIVRQTTIFIAQLATSGGVRAPLAQVADQVFLELARELEAQGVSRKVSADMFGLALRSYRRRIQRVQESGTERNRSLWEAILDFLSTRSLVLRSDVLRRFRHDDETSVRGVLHDLCESGLVLKLGSGNEVAYRAATTEELRELQASGSGSAELLWALIYREGPVTKSELARLVAMPEATLDKELGDLVTRGSVQLSAEGQYSSRNMVLPLGAAVGWEAAFFDHFQAMVKTLCARLREGPDPNGLMGGSTYSFNVWPGHPCEEEARSTLQQLRTRCSELRKRVQDFNDTNGLPDSYEKIVVYAGQCAIEQEKSDDTEARGEEQK
jgi:hypothetical protein